MCCVDRGGLMLLSCRQKGEVDEVDCAVTVYIAFGVDACLEPMLAHYLHIEAVNKTVAVKVSRRGPAKDFASRNLKVIEISLIVHDDAAV